jgi:hypothetical protein
MTKEQNSRLEFIKKAVKANIHIVKDMNRSLPMCGGLTEHSKDTPTVIFIAKALESKIDEDLIIDFLQIKEEDYEKLKSRYPVLAQGWKFRQKEQLVTNYLKYNG